MPKIATFCKFLSLLGLKKDNAIDFLVFKAGHFQFEGVMPHCNNVTCISKCTFYIILYIKGSMRDEWMDD